MSSILAAPIGAKLINREEIIRRRYEAGLKNFWALYQPLADAWSVYDNSVSEASISVASGGKRQATTILDQDSWTSFAATKL
jgi:predicted ABC-type ATPase